MRTRIYRDEIPVYVTGTTEMRTVLCGNEIPILVHEKQELYKPRITAKQFAFYRKWGVNPFHGFVSLRELHRFIERFFPRTEGDIKGLLLFKKKQIQGNKQAARQRKAPLECGALKVA